MTFTDLPPQTERGAMLTAQTDEGFLVASISRERGYFSVTGSIYPSRRAYELGNENSIFACGCLHEQILDALPELAPIVAVHLADVETGEPMHGPDDGWYRLSGENIASDVNRTLLYGSGNYFDAPEPFVDDEGTVAIEQFDGFYLNPEYARYFIEMAARTLRCHVDELPNVQDPELFDEWIDSVMRPRWAEEASRANALIDVYWALDDGDEPEREDGEEWSIELDAGLKVGACVYDEAGYREGVGHHYRYSVTVQAPQEDGTLYTYDAEYGGSVADYNDGKVSAREAALGVLHELVSVYRNNTARSFIEDDCGEDWDELPQETRNAMAAAEAAYDAMEDALLANEEVIGS